MPPKAKKPDANKNQGPIEDESGIPKNEVTFKFSFEIKQNEVADILIMFEWINSGNSAAREKLDTELIEGWEQKTAEDPTVVKSEIEASSFVVEDKFVQNLCSNKFYVHFVSAEDQKVKDTLLLHYSPLLTAKGEPKFEFYHDKIKIPQIEYFKLTVTADKELLTPMFKDYLNPLEVCILGAKEMPANHSGYDKYEPVYVQAKFFDGTIIKTHDQPHGASCKWAYKQVILVGLMNPVKLAETLKSCPLTFEVHDQDELARNQIRDFKQLIAVKYEEPEAPADLDPKGKGKGAAPAKDAKKGKEPEKKEEKKDNKDAKGKKDPKKKRDVKTFEPIKEQDTREITRTDYGISMFNLNDLLNPHITSLKLRNHIVPLQKYEDKDAQNLDLNTTARRDIQGLHVGCDYMSNESYLVVTFEIAHAIRAFKKPVVPQTEAEPAPTKAKPAANTKPASQKKDERRPETAEVKAVEADDGNPVYERAVYVFPYKSADLTTKLMAIIQEINTSAFGADNNPLFITTKCLTEEEKKNKDLDIITGVEFIDKEYRTFIVEGLSDKGMKKLEEDFPKVQPNSKELQILKNPTYKFKDRLYIGFNIDIKKIKLRENLTKLLSRPEIYLRSKVPEHIYNILITFNELRRCESLKAAVASDLFPDAENIMAMERKYGDALTNEDVDGREGTPQKVVKRTAPRLSKVNSELGLSAIQSIKSHATPGIISKRTNDISQSAEKLPSLRSRGQRSLSTKLATRLEHVHHEKYSLHMTQLYPVKQGEEVFTQSGAPLNIYEKQRAELREIARNDPNHFYTYSENYLSLSIDPYTPEDLKKEEFQNRKTLWRTKEGFQTILKKSKEEYNVHIKKPHPSKIDELMKHPWHQSKLEETTHLKNTRGEPIRNGPDFRGKVMGDTFFSSPQIIETEKMTAVEKERQIVEAKKKAEEEWKSKLIVSNSVFHTALCMNRNSQLDKIKGIRLGEAVKKGIIMKDSRLKTTTLGTTKVIEENPISIYLSEKWEESSGKNFFERQLDVQKATSHYDFKRNIKEAHQYELVYKPMKETFKDSH